jgi:exosome complex protein LRP1
LLTEIAYLKLHGTKAQEHPVFKELTRVKQYFAKIKALESPPEEEAKPTMKLDQQAARRFIKHGLVCYMPLFSRDSTFTDFAQAGNDQYDIERAEKQAKEKARAHLKAAMLAKKSKEESSASTPSQSQEPSNPATPADSSDSDAEEESASESEESEDQSPTEHVDTKLAKSAAVPEDFIQLPSELIAESKTAKNKTAKAKAKQRKEDLIKAKKAERQAKREAKGIPEPDSKQQRKMARKERRRNKEAKRKEKKKNKDKKKQ